MTKRIVEEKTYHYFAFGLHLESALPLPELESVAAGTADVRIHLGEVPDTLRAPLEKGAFYQASVGEFLFRIEGVAAYYVSRGQRVVVQPFTPEGNLVRLFLLGTTLGVVLMQRGIAAMHGSTVAVDGRGLLLTGFVGAGKSTLAGALRIKGCAVVSDDVSALRRDETGTFWVQPGYPLQKLDQASAALLGIDTQGLPRVGDRDKFAVSLTDDFCHQSVPVAAIYLLVPCLCRTASITPLTGMDKLAALMENTYRVELVRGLGLTAAHFRHCAALAQKTPMFLLTRPQTGASPDLQADAVLRHCRNLLAAPQAKK